MEPLLFSSVPFLPIVVFWLIFALAVCRYWDAHSRLPFRALARIVLWFRLAYAALLTVLQYYLWSKDSFTRTFLDMPADRASGASAWLFGSNLGYFLFYSWGRFWLGALLSIGAALLFWWFLRALERHNSRFFLPGETDLGFLVALIVGWPNFVIFIPLVFLSVILVSFIRLLLFHERLTTLGWPFLLAGTATLLCGSALVDFMRLSVLRV